MKLTSWWTQVLRQAMVDLLLVEAIRGAATFEEKYMTWLTGDGHRD
jgi:hypothetical protein